MATDTARLRRDFPLLSTRMNGHPLVYLDNAATTQKPRSVIDALSNHYKRGNANVHRGAHGLSDQATRRFEQVRQQLAQWIGAASHREIIWTRGTTEGINLVAQSYLRPRLKPGDRILLMESNHHANIVPWQLVAAATDAVIDVLPTPGGEIDQDHYRTLLARGPKLVALTQVSNALGSRFAVAELCALARQAGARVLVDGAQALPHFDIDLHHLGCDFYAFSGHKLFAPTGIGVLWGREALLETLPPWQGGGEMIETVSFSGNHYAPLPFRLEAGTPHIAGVIGLGAAIDYLQRQDRASLEAHEQALLAHALDCCSSIPGFSPLPASGDRVSLVSFLLEGHHPQDVALWLDHQGIAVRAGHHCAMPLMEALKIKGTVRASFAFYNTLEEAEQLARALDQLVLTENPRIPVKEQHGNIAARLQAVYDARGWDARYRALMQLGSALPHLPDELRQPRYRLHGCESRVWLVPAVDEEGRLNCRADADARILRALLALLLNTVNGQTPREVLTLDLRGQIAALELESHLSPSRGNGLNAMIDALLSWANTAIDSG